MKRLTRKQIIMIGGAIIVLALIILAFLPKPIPVQTALVEQGLLQVVVEEEGNTEVADRYALTAPVASYLRRITLRAGDVVQRGQPVVRLESPRAPILDARTRTEAAAHVRAAQATARNAHTERDRIARLFANGAATQQQLDQARAEAARAAADLAAAQAALRNTGAPNAQPVSTVISAPVGGRVLAVRRQSAGQVNPGDTLIVIGDARNLEVHVAVLSEDAVRMHPGTRVLIDQWGGDTTLEAVVRRVEPQGFTKVSSLGVEEQRVPVVASLISSPELWPNLGSGYRVLARFIIWEAANVLQVPSAALFRSGDGWVVFVVDNGRARLRRVTVGQQAGLQTQVVSGLKKGEEVVVHPGNAVEDGVRLKSEREE